MNPQKNPNVSLDLEDAEIYVKALEPVTSRVRTDVTAKRTNQGGIRWAKGEALTQKRLIDHVIDRCSRGCCPIKAGESTTRLALFDLDSHQGESDWGEMVHAAKQLTSELAKNGMEPIPWRSRGGRGIHIFLLWESNQDAYSVRQFLKNILNSIGYKDGTKGIKAREIEIFPKQNSVPVDGFGNQFILPLAGKSVPLSTSFEPMEREAVVGMTWTLSPSIKVVEKAEQKNYSIPSANINLAQRALLSITNDFDRDDWFKLLCAFKGAAGTEGYDIALQWSSTHSSHKKENFDKTWKSIKTRKKAGLPPDYLFSIAESQGFKEHLFYDVIDCRAESIEKLKVLYEPCIDLVLSNEEIALIVDENLPYVMLEGDEWHKLISRICELTGRTFEEIQGKIEQSKPSDSWHIPADIFTKSVTPVFPLEALPACFVDYSEDLSRQTGFDAGGFAFCLLACVGAWVDQRAKMKITDSYQSHAFFWGGLVDESGGGKSPILNSSSRFINQINDRLMQESSNLLSEWEVRQRNLSKGSQTESKPIWRQRIGTDLTVEALAQLLVSNGEGVLILADEITEVIGRMDAYSGTNNGGSKDRGVFIRAFDSKKSTINRKSGNTYIENFSAAMLAGIQPEKLADLFRKAPAAGADGLYQRFVFYSLQPARNADYEAQIDPDLLEQVGRIFKKINDWNETGVFLAENAYLSSSARKIANKYHDDIRVVAGRTVAQRFKEHLNKFPGFLYRITFSLHCLECAVRGEYQPEVSDATLRRGMDIMSCLYHHSEAVYAILENAPSEVVELVRSAAEAILSKGYSQFQKGDLTRNATGWQKLSNNLQITEAAIDLLIDLGWARDITPPKVPGQRGRKTLGLFAVNPQVKTMFCEQSERIRLARSQRFEAIQRVAEKRGNSSRYGNEIL